MTGEESAKLIMLGDVRNFLGYYMTALKELNPDLPGAFIMFDKASGELFSLKDGLSRTQLTNQKKEIRQNVTIKIMVLAKIMKRIATEKMHAELAAANSINSSELNEKSELSFCKIGAEILKRCEDVKVELREYNIMRMYLWEVDKRLNSYKYIVTNFETIMAEKRNEFENKMRETFEFLKVIDKLMLKIKDLDPRLYEVYKFNRMIHKKYIRLYSN